MKNHKVLMLLLLLVLPWLSVPFLSKKSFKRFFPAAIFICTLTSAIDLFGVKNKLWHFYRGIPPFNSMNFYNLGPYFVTSLWILKMTYGKFPLYIIVNFVLHICFSFLGGVKLADRFKIFTFTNFTKLQYIGLNTLRALVLYWFQFINDLSHGKNALKRSE